MSLLSVHFVRAALVLLMVGVSPASNLGLYPANSLWVYRYPHLRHTSFAVPA